MIKISQPFKWFAMILILSHLSFNLYGESFTAASDIWTPFVMYSDNQFSGIGYDILIEVAKRSGDTVSVQYVPNKRAQNMFDNGDIDISVIDSSLWNDPAKSDSFVFTDDIMIVREFVYFLKEDAIKVIEPDDLFGKTVSIMNGYYYPVFDEALQRGDISYIEVGSEESLVKMLILKRADAIFMDSIAFGNTISKLGYDHELFVRSFQLSETSLGIKIRHEKSYVLPRFNAAIASMQEDGTISRIINKYIQTP